MAIAGSSDQLRAIIRTQTEIVSGDLEPEAIMQLIAERAQEPTGASSGVIELAEGSGACSANRVSPTRRSGSAATSSRS
ncbi:MAG TPA: hypothetical protein VFS64_10530 [Solirubrobacterales bacterium]|nr:hypothetical protein [Solirubrobacterales bacterium]